MLIISNCKDNKHKKIEPPVDFLPVREYGFRNIFHMKTKTDSLNIVSRLYIPEKINKKIEMMFSIMELYDLKDSLLYRSIQTKQHAQEMIQDKWLAPIPADTMRLRSWGVYFDVKPDSSTVYDETTL